jgi:uncharacterized protein (DUF2141 family)
MPSAVRLIWALLGLAMASLPMAPGAARAASSVDTGLHVVGSTGLHVVVSNVRSARGHIRVDVCSAEEFLQDCIHSGAEPAEAGETTVVVPDVPPGVYAVQVYQDENDNHKVDRNLLGLPKEGVGFSNDAPIRFAPPRFPAAAFTYAGGEKTIRLRLRHFLN